MYRYNLLTNKFARCILCTRMCYSLCHVLNHVDKLAAILHPFFPPQYRLQALHTSKHFATTQCYNDSFRNTDCLQWFFFRLNAMQKVTFLWILSLANKTHTHLVVFQGTTLLFHTEFSRFLYMYPAHTSTNLVHQHAANSSTPPGMLIRPGTATLPLYPAQQRKSKKSGSSSTNQGFPIVF